MTDFSGIPGKHEDMPGDLLCLLGKNCGGPLLQPEV